MKILKLLMRVAMCSLLATASAVFAQAATVFELTGTATAALTRAAAAPGAAPAPAPVGRTLRKGDAVNQGETIATGAMSSIVLRFADGQVAALSANSSMAINNYVYNAAEPAKSNVLLSLLNGGMRAVTGLIGKARPESVSYRAGNATIGIRGTDVVMVVDGVNVVAQVIAGRISFTFNGVTVNIPAGQGTYIDMSKPNAPILVLSAADLAKVVKVQSLAAVNNLTIMRFYFVFVDTGPGRTDETTVLSDAARNNVTGLQLGGGGAGLPNCSLVSPVSSRQPGTNCIAG